MGIGWAFHVKARRDVEREDGATNSPLLARWRDSYDGLRWLDDLVSRGEAVDLGGDGYPCRYEVKAGILMRELRRGLPGHSEPSIMGDDNSVRDLTVRGVVVNIGRMESLASDEVLIVDAWDQS